MQSKVFFRSASDNDYEITVEHEPYTHVPSWILEQKDGTIVDMNIDRSWESLPAMTHDLEIKVIDFESEVGD